MYPPVITLRGTCSFLIFPVSSDGTTWFSPAPDEEAVVRAMNLACHNGLSQQIRRTGPDSTSLFQQQAPAIRRRPPVQHGAPLLEGKDPRGDAYSARQTRAALAKTRQLDAATHT